MNRQRPDMVAAIKISRLEKLKCETVAIVPADLLECRLPIVRTVREGKTGAPLWHYVNRLDYIRWLKTTNMVFKKREINLSERLRNVRNSL